MTFESLILDNALELLVDNRGKNPPYEATGIPVVSGMSVRQGRVDLSEAKRASVDTWKKWMPMPTRPDDVLLTSEAPLGRTALIRTTEPLVIGQRVFCLRGRKGVLDSRFLYYSLQTESVQADLHGRATGTTVLGIRQPELRKVRIPAPGHDEQLMIAEFLGALDDKIAANDRLNYAIDEFLGASFDSLRYGADWGTLEDIAKINVAIVRPFVGGSLRYLDISSVSVGRYEFPPITSWDDAPSRARRVLKSGDTIWSTVRPNRKSHALILDNDAKLVGSTGFAVLSPIQGRVACVYESTRTDEFVRYLESVAEGSAYPAVRADRFNRAPVPALIDEEWSRFESMALPLRIRAHAATQEMRLLVNMRDELLPLLMSGKIRFRDAEEIAEEAVR